MRFLALDLSVKSAGFSLWETGWEKPKGGTWSLGASLEDTARAFLRVHQNLNDIHSVAPLDWIIYEKPVDPASFGHRTGFDVPFALIGLAAHVDSYCEAKGIPCRCVPMATWRRYFIGKMKRGTKSKQLKEYAMERCRELGFSFQKHDEAEAHGILSYFLNLRRIETPWERDHLLKRELA